MNEGSNALHRAVGLEPPTLTRDEVGALTGSELDRIIRWWRALGFPEVPPDVVAFGQSDVDVVRRLSGLLDEGTATDESVQRLARLLGASFSRIAEAQVAMLEGLVGVAGLDQFIEQESVSERFVDALLYVWRRHLLAALGRAIGERPGDDRTSIEQGVEQGVGFADLSGFTKLTQRLEPDALGTLIDAFETAAFDAVMGGGGRVVKLIGDEVMWTAPSASSTVAIGVDMMRQVALVEGMPEMHIGLAFGPTVALGGDVFGPTVNLAARLTSIARRGTIALPREMAAELAASGDVLDGLDVRRVRRSYDLKGIGDVKIAVLRVLPDVPLSVEP